MGCIVSQFCNVKYIGRNFRGKFDFDVVGHYARPDVFRLHVNEESRPVVVGVTDPIRIE